MKKRILKSAFFAKMPETQDFSYISGMLLFYDLLFLILKSGALLSLDTLS